MKTTLLMTILCCIATGCGTAQPPQELLEARQAYAVSAHSPTAQYDPQGLRQAKGALDNAEKLYKSDSDSWKTRDAAYVATRKAERAQIDGETAALQKQMQVSAQNQQAAQATEHMATQEQLQATQEQLAMTQQALQESEEKNQQAMMQLKAKETAVSQQGNNTIITVAGAFLFPSGKATLRGKANPSLDKIAFVLKQQPDKDIMIVGHTDSTGTDAVNMRLSKERADAVANYLAARGVSRDKITTDGVGAARPIASNDTKEGRAANRRVEITVHPASS